LCWGIDIMEGKLGSTAEIVSAWKSCKHQ